MATWKHADSLSLIQRWLAEYNREAARMPELRFETMLSTMSKAIPTEPEEVRVDSEKAMETAKNSAEELLQNFREMRHYLERLLALWQEFEALISSIESELIVAESDQRKLPEDLSQQIRRCEEIGAEIVQSSASTGAHLTVQERLSNVVQRAGEKASLQTATPSGARLVVNIQMSPKEGRRRRVEPLKKTEEKVLPADSELQQWVAGGRKLLVKKVTEITTATTLVTEITEHIKKLSQIEDETQPESQPAVQQLRSHLLERLDALRLVHPILASTERYIREMEDWTRRHDPESEIGKKSIRERCEVVEQIGNMLDVLESSSYAPFVDASELRQLHRTISTSIVLVETRRLEITVEVIETRVLVSVSRARKQGEGTFQVAEVFQTIPEEQAAVASELAELESLQAIVDEQTAHRIETLRHKLDERQQSTSVAALSPASDLFPTPSDRVAELLRRKAEICARKEDSVEAVKASIREMDMVNEAIELHNGNLLGYYIACG